MKLLTNHYYNGQSYRKNWKWNKSKLTKRQQKEERTQIDKNQVPLKHIEITASQQTPPNQH